MNIKESWARVFLFALVCGTVDFLMVLLFGGGSMTALMSTIAVGVGYAYGTVQMMYLYKRDVHAAIKELASTIPDKKQE